MTKPACACWGECAAPGDAGPWCEACWNAYWRPDAPAGYEAPCSARLDADVPCVWADEPIDAAPESMSAWTFTYCTRCGRERDWTVRPWEESPRA